MSPSLAESSSRKRVAIAQLSRLIVEILYDVVHECNAEVVAETATCDEALRLIQSGLRVDLVIAPLLSLATVETEAELRHVEQDVRILAMSPSRCGVAVYELRVLSADIGLSGIADAVREVLTSPARYDPA